MGKGEIKPIKIEGDLAYVPLTRGYVATIDSSDLHLVEGHRWFAVVFARSAYARRNDYTGPKQKSISMHRLIMEAPKGLDVDHIDGDGLNNRRCNLRLATRSQNLHNQQKRCNNTSGFKGVSFVKASGKWLARIMLEGKRKTLGHFSSPEEAHDAYAKASLEYHGKFGRTQ